MDQTPITPNQTPIPPTPVVPKKSNASMIVIFIAIIILIAGLVYFLLLPKKSELTQGPSTPDALQTEEEKEVDAVDITDTTSIDFVEVEKDIKSL